MTTPLPYVPTEPTEPIPEDILVLTDIELVNALKAFTDTLTSAGRLNVSSALDQANHQVKHIVNRLYDRLVFFKGVSDGVDEKQRVIDELEARFRNLDAEHNENRRALQRSQQNLNRMRGHRDDAQAMAGRLRAERDDLHDRSNRLHLINNNLRPRINRLTGERDGAVAQYNLVFGQLGHANALLAHANNRVQFGVRALARLRQRFLRQIAALRIQAQWFRIRHINPHLNNPPLPTPTTWLLLH